MNQDHDEHNERDMSYTPYIGRVAIHRGDNTKGPARADQIKASIFSRD